MSGSEDEGRQPSVSDEQVLAYKRLEIQQKRFYLDVKENRRGRFIKIAEFSSAGRKNRLLLSLPIAHQFKDQLTHFNDLYVNLGPQNSESSPEDGKIKSAVLYSDTRRYYLDLKENDRGRFLRVSQTVRNNRNRTQIGIPAQGMIEFRDALTDLLDEYGATDEDDTQGEKHANSVSSETNHNDRASSNSYTAAQDKDLPEGTDIRVENKRFFFDVRQNKNGIFMRVSEVKNNFRASITIPDSAWPRFRDVFAEYADKCLTSADVKSDEADHKAN